MSWLSPVFLLVLTAIGFSYIRVRLERATPPLPADDEGDAQPIDCTDAAPMRLNPATTGAMFGFIWRPLP